MNSSMLHIRMDDDIKAQATATLAVMGLSTSDAVRLFFHRIIAEQAFPLELKVPNSATRDAMAEADAILAIRNLRYQDADVLIADLDG